MWKAVSVAFGSNNSSNACYRIESYCLAALASCYCNLQVWRDFTSSHCQRSPTRASCRSGA